MGEVAAVRDTYLQTHPLPGGYDFSHYKKFHRTLFRDAFTWAGQPRSVEISKGLPFAYVQHLESSGQTLLPAADAADSVTRRIGPGLARHVILEELTELLGDLNALHPFREGNGRTQRAFLRQLAAQANWRVDWSKMSKLENDAASWSSLAGDNEPLRHMLDRLLSRLTT